MKLLIYLSLLLPTTYASAQALGDMSLSIDDDRIIWKTAHIVDARSGDQSISEDVFKSTPDSIFWTHGASVYRMHIESTHTRWPDVREDGSQTYDVIWNKISGTILFQKNNGETSITTTFIRDGVNAAPFQFEVSDMRQD
jgi:hypothetical protein